LPGIEADARHPVAPAQLQDVALDPVEVGLVARRDRQPVLGRPARVARVARLQHRRLVQVAAREGGVGGLAGVRIARWEDDRERDESTIVGAPVQDLEGAFHIVVVSETRTSPAAFSRTAAPPPKQRTNKRPPSAPFTSSGRA
jgi:hypothetical protein